MSDQEQQDSAAVEDTVLVTEDLSESTDQETDTDEETTELSFTEQVDNAVELIEHDAELGVLSLPKTISDDVAFAAKLAYENIQHQQNNVQTTLQIKQLKKNKSILLDEIGKSTGLSLTSTQQAELEDLKFSDPDGWRNKLNKLEAEAKDVAKTQIEKKLNIKLDGEEQEAEVEYRTKLLAQHNRDNPDFQLTDEVIQNNIPPRIVQQLGQGKITFPSFLKKAKGYLLQNKTVQKQKINPTHNLSKIAGLEQAKIVKGKTPAYKDMMF